jgi:anti-sigma B factor antagonist
MTTPSSARLLVFVSGQMACVKIVGRANFTSSIDFKTLVNELMEQKFTCFLLDLSECVLMDSTFLGVMAGFGLKMTVSTGGQRNGNSIELLNPNSRIAELLENLGVAHLFKVVNGAPALPKEGGVEAPSGSVEPSREEVKQNCLEAHRILMAIDPSNIPKFKEVAQFLAEDLKKAKSGS